MDEETRGDWWIYRQPQAFILFAAVVLFGAWLTILGLQELVPSFRVFNRTPEQEPAPVPAPKIEITGEEFKPPQHNFKTTGTPVQKDFANGVFKEGDSVEVLLKAHKPVIRIIHPPYQTLFFGNPEGAFERLELPPFRGHFTAEDLCVISLYGNLAKARSQNTVFFSCRVGNGLVADVEWDSEYMQTYSIPYLRLFLEHLLRSHAALVGGPASIGWYTRQRPGLLAKYFSK